MISWHSIQGPLSSAKCPLVTKILMGPEVISELCRAKRLHLTLIFALASSHHYTASTTMRQMSSDASAYQFETLKVTSPQDNILHVELNRPEKRNAMNMVFFR